MLYPGEILLLLVSSVSFRFSKVLYHFAFTKWCITLLFEGGLSFCYFVYHVTE